MIRPLLGLTLLFVINDSLRAQNAETQFEGPYHLVASATKKLSILMEFEVPAMSGAVLYPFPPSNGSQRIVAAEMYLEVGKAKVKAAKTFDQSPFKKPLLTASVTSAKGFKAFAKLDIDFQEVKLTPGKSPKPAPRLTKSETALYTQVEPSYEYDNSTFKAWTNRHDLTRQKGERDLVFAHRLLGFIREHFTYDYPPPKVFKARVAELGRGEMGYFVTERKGECWGLSRVYTCILRASGIPCRQVSGRLMDKGTHHLRAEVYLDGIGWIHADPAAVVSFRKSPLTDYFGNGGDYMLVLNTGINFVLPGPKNVSRLGTFSGFVLARANLEWEIFFGTMKVSAREK